MLDQTSPNQPQNLLVHVVKVLFIWHSTTVLTMFLKTNPYDSFYHTFEASSNSKLPLSLCRQPLAHPLTICLSIIVAYMNSWIWQFLFNWGNWTSWLGTEKKSKSLKLIQHLQARERSWMFVSGMGLKDFEVLKPLTFWLNDLST